MQSVREQIVQTLLARLETVIAAHHATLHRQTSAPLDRTQTPALVLMVDTDTVQRLNEIVHRELHLRVVALAVGSTTQSPATIADALMRDAHAAMMLDQNVNALAITMAEQDSDWQQDESDHGLIALTTRYLVRYRTRVSDLTQRG